MYREEKETKTPYRCNNCGLSIWAGAFEPKYHHAACLRTRICLNCELRRQCKQCKEWKSEDGFLKGEWEHAQWSLSLRGRCRSCILDGAEQKKETKTKQCSGICKGFKTHDCFTGRQWLENAATRKCKSCMNNDSMEPETKKCAGQCQEFKVQGSFTKRQWVEDNKTRKCLQCMDKKRGYWICVDVECKAEKPIDDFSMWLKKRSLRKNNGTARCNVCFRKHDAERNASIKEAAADVMKRKR